MIVYSVQSKELADLVTVIFIAIMGFEAIYVSIMQLYCK